MATDILELVRADLRGASLARQKEVADACGIPWSTLRKIIDKDTADPRYGTVQKLRAYYLSPAELAAEGRPAPQQVAYRGPERRKQMVG